jgi:hypothetical protein
MTTHGGKRTGAGRKTGFNALEAEKARELICLKLSENLGPIADIAIKQAKKGDRHARQWLMERAYGKVGTITELEEEKELPIPLLFGIGQKDEHTQELVKKLTAITNEHRKKYGLSTERTGASGNQITFVDMSKPREDK